MEPNKQFSPPKSFVADLAPDVGEVVKADRATRFGAKLIDTVIYSILVMPAVIVAVQALPNTPAARAASLKDGSLYLAMAHTGIWFYGGLCGLLIVMVVNLVLLQRNGQTIGKKMLGIRIVRSDGSRATLGRIFWLRGFVNGLFYYIPFVGRLYALVDSLAIFGSARRCVHDYVADTIVVRV